MNFKLAQVSQELRFSRTDVSLKMVYVQWLNLIQGIMYISIIRLPFSAAYNYSAQSWFDLSVTYTSYICDWRIVIKRFKSTASLLVFYFQNSTVGTRGYFSLLSFAFPYLTPTTYFCRLPRLIMTLFLFTMCRLSLYCHDLWTTYIKLLSIFDPKHQALLLLQILLEGYWCMSEWFYPWWM